MDFTLDDDERAVTEAAAQVAASADPYVPPAGSSRWRSAVMDRPSLICIKALAC